MFESKLGQFLVGRESNGKRHRRRVKIKRWTGTRRRTRGARSCHRWDAAINRDVAALWRRHVTWDFSLSFSLFLFLFSFFSLSFLFDLLVEEEEEEVGRWGGAAAIKCQRPSTVSSAFFCILQDLFENLFRI